MKTYTFFYRIDSAPGDILFKCRAERLRTALRLFWRESLKFACPVTALLPYYEVINDEGKISFRVLPLKYMNEEII